MSRPWPPPVSIAILLAIVSLLAEARLQIGSAQPGIPIPLSPNLAASRFRQAGIWLVIPAIQIRVVTS